MNVKDDPKVQLWFDLNELAESSRCGYGTYMKQFCELNNKSPTELIDEAIAEIRAGKLPSECNTVSYIAKFRRSLRERELARTTQRSSLECIKSFYKAYDIQLSSLIGKVRNARPLRENLFFLTREDVQKLLINAKLLRDRAIILTMASSGMAKQEIRNLRIKDLTFDEDGVGIVDIRRQKTQRDYMTFISPEGVMAIKKYFEERSRSDRMKINGDDDFVFITYRRGRKLAQLTFTFRFLKLARELGFTNGKYWTKSRSHSLRRFFASTLENAGMPRDKVNFMLGHCQSANDLAYFKADTSKLKELYKKFLPYLTLERNLEIRSLDVAKAKLLDELLKENQDFKAALESIESKTKDLKKEYDEMKNKLDFLDNAFAEGQDKMIEVEREAIKIETIMPEDSKQLIEPRLPDIIHNTGEILNGNIEAAKCRCESSCAISQKKKLNALSHSTFGKCFSHLGKIKKMYILDMLEIIKEDYPQYFELNRDVYQL